jgi:hypothetical protein
VGADRCLQTSQAATAIVAYNVVQTDPKTQPGGVHGALLAAAYHPGALLTIATELSAETAKDTARNPTRAAA